MMWPQHDRAAEGENMTQPCCQRHGRVVCMRKAKMNYGDLTGTADDRCNLRPGMVQHWPTVHSERVSHLPSTGILHSTHQHTYCVQVA